MRAELGSGASRQGARAHKHHSEFPTDAPALYTTTFAMTMNKARYDSLPADLKKVIDANSGADLSAWLGKIQQSGDGRGRKLAEDRGNAIHTFSKPETQQFIERNPTVLEARVFLAAAHAASGDLDSARWEAEEIRQLFPAFTVQNWLEPSR